MPPKVPRDGHQSPQSRSSWSFGSILALLIGLSCYFLTGRSLRRLDPLDFAQRAEHILSTTPLIDGHNDLPYLLRIELQNRIYNTDVFTFRKGRLACSEVIEAFYIDD